MQMLGVNDYFRPSPVGLTGSVGVCAPGVVMEDPYWQSFMEQAVRLMYFLAESPDQLCSRLLQRSTRLLLDQIAESSEPNQDAGPNQEVSQESSEQGEQGVSQCVFTLDTCMIKRKLRNDARSPVFHSHSELRVSGPVVGSVWQRGFLAGVSP